MTADLRDDDVVQIAPHRHAGSREGFVPIIEANADLVFPDPEALGKTVRAGFERAE